MSGVSDFNFGHKEDAEATGDGSAIAILKRIRTLLGGAGASASQVDDAAFTPATSGIMMAGFFADETAPDVVNEGDGGAARMTLYRAVHVNVRDASGNELSPPSLTARLLSAAASTNATNAKNAAGYMYGIRGYNARGSAVYLKLYNKASSPTVGSDTPVQTIYLPATAAFAVDWPVGYYFSTGISFALTTAGADADTGALTAGDILALNLDYA